MTCEQFVGIIANKKYSFSEDDVSTCKNIHKVKRTQGNLKIEDKLFKRAATNVRIPCSCLVVGDTILKSFKNLIQQVRKDFAVDNQPSPRFLYSNLSLLVAQHWVTFEVTEAFVKVFNRSESNFTKIYSFLFLVDLETNRSSKKRSLIGKLNKSIKFVLLLLLVWTFSVIRLNRMLNNEVTITKTPKSIT